jgi:putative transposase
MTVGTRFFPEVRERAFRLVREQAPHQRGSWKRIEDVEFVTLCWVSWYNAERLMEPLGDSPSAEYEARYLRAQSSELAEVGLNELHLLNARRCPQPAT